MDFNFKGLPQLLKRFPNDASARAYFEAKRWNGTPVCPFCGSTRWYKLKDGKTYKCGDKSCYKKYTVTVGTIFHSSHIPLNMWFAAMYLIGSHKKGISSHQMAKDLGITQKSAWFMLHRIREMYREKTAPKLSGVVEADETYMSRKYKTDFSHLTPEEYQYAVEKKKRQTKGLVFGMVQRDGKVVVKAMEQVDGKQIRATIHSHVEPHSWLMTDDAFLYRTGLEKYKHESVTHSKKEYVRGDIHTNNIENFWGLMKRGIYGIYHQISYKHLQRYADEFSFRYNNRKMPDGSRFILSLDSPEGRLKYRELISNEPKQKEEPPTQKESEWE